MALRAHLQDRYEVGTANAYLKTVRVIARECWRLGLMTVEQFSKVQDVPNIPGKSLPAGREVQPHELTRLFAIIAKDDSPMGVRDAAMLAALYGTGMRRAGLAGLKVGDYDPHAVTFRIVEKGNQERESPAPSWVKKPMAAWLALRGDHPGALFVSFKWGRMDTTFAHMTPEAAWHMLCRRVEEAGLPKFTTHDLRRTYIGNMFEEGVGVEQVAHIVGHKDINTTAAYDRRPKKARQRAAERLPNPMS
jgi:integrase